MDKDIIPYNKKGIKLALDSKELEIDDYFINLSIKCIIIDNIIKQKEVYFNLFLYSYQKQLLQCSRFHCKTKRDIFQSLFAPSVY